MSCRCCIDTAGYCRPTPDGSNDYYYLLVLLLLQLLHLLLQLLLLLLLQRPNEFQKESNNSTWNTLYYTYTWRLDTSISFGNCSALWETIPKLSEAQSTDLQRRRPTPATGASCRCDLFSKMCQHIATVSFVSVFIFVLTGKPLDAS